MTSVNVSFSNEPTSASRTWFLIPGIALIALGLAAGLAPWLATLTSVLIFGWLLMLAGTAELVAAAWARPWSVAALHLTGALLGIVAGVLIVAHPGAGALSLTLLLASFFLIGGLFRAIAAPVLRYPARLGLGASRRRGLDPARRAGLGRVAVVVAG